MVYRLTGWAKIIGRAGAAAVRNAGDDNGLKPEGEFS